MVPGPDNIRRRNLETYFQSHGVEVAAMLEMDAMIATLEFVARSDWVTILPSVISVNDIGRGELIVNPIAEPGAARRIRGDPADTAHALDASAAVPATLRSGSRAYPRGVGCGIARPMADCGPRSKLSSQAIYDVALHERCRRGLRFGDDVVVVKPLPERRMGGDLGVADAQIRVG